jgi:hypothetical protein
MAMSKFGEAFAAARKRGDKTFEFKGKKYNTKTKEDKDQEVTPEAKKAMDTMRMDRASNMRAQARRADVAMETPEERGAMSLKGFKRDKEDMSGSGEYSPFKTGGAIKMNYGGKVKMKHGGKVHKKGCDGIAKKGKTKGRMC